MSPRDKFKTRPPISEAKQLVVDFMGKQRMMNMSVVASNNVAVIDSVDYFYFNGKHIAVLSPMSKIRTVLCEGSIISAFVQVGHGKEAQKLYATFHYHDIDSESDIINELEKTNPMLGKMRSHNARFIELNINEAVIMLSDQEIYNLDNDLNPTFAKFSLNGRERFEYSRKLLMCYLGREVIFNVVIENDTYYTLTKADSNKMSHIKSGGVCEIFDGKNNHFETVIKIEEGKVDEIFEKLVATNNAYFKENVDLVALSFEVAK